MLAQVTAPYAASTTRESMATSRIQPTPKQERNAWSLSVVVPYRLQTTPSGCYSAMTIRTHTTSTSCLVQIISFRGQQVGSLQRCSDQVCTSMPSTSGKFLREFKGNQGNSYYKCSHILLLEDLTNWSMESTFIKQFIWTSDPYGNVSYNILTVCHSTFIHTLN